MSKEDIVEIPKRILQALLISHLYVAGLVAGCPVELLEREIKDVHIEGDRVIITYEKSKYVIINTVRLTS